MICLRFCLTTHQSLWIILCSLPEERRKETEDLVEYREDRHRGGWEQKTNDSQKQKYFTVFTLSIQTPQLLTILVLKFEQKQFPTRCCVKKLLDEWQTVQTLMRRRILRRLIWVYTVSSCLPVRIHTVNTVTCPFPSLLRVHQTLNTTLFAGVQALKDYHIQSTPFISNSKGLTETLRDIRTSTYQSWESEENNKLNNHI